MRGRFQRLKETLLEALHGSLRRPERLSEPSVSGSHLEDRTSLSGQVAQKPLLHDASTLIAGDGHDVSGPVHPVPTRDAADAMAKRVVVYFDPNFKHLWLKRLGIASDAEFFQKVLPKGTTPNGVFSTKVHWHQFECLAGKLRAVHGDGNLLELLERTFPDPRYVFLTRRDKVRQAVSCFRAIETNAWWSVWADGPAGRSRLRHGSGHADPDCRRRLRPPIRTFRFALTN